MKVFWSVADVGDETKNAALAIGNFDGVHLGHQALIRKARELSSKASVLTFTPHPETVLHSDAGHFYLTSDQQKIELFAKLGVANAIIHRIDKDFLKKKPEDFVEHILLKRLKVKYVVVGEDFTFGYRAMGDISVLKALSERFGFITLVVPPVIINGQRISSSIIRQDLRSGELDLARAMLGRPYSLLGVVEGGQKKGGILGFATANITPPLGFGLKTGVYATVVRVGDGDAFQDYLSVTNVGFRPTVTTKKTLVVESHCLDQDLELYGQVIKVFFIHRLRDEQAFPSITVLQEQVEKDCQAVRQMYHSPAQARFRVRD
ncbi:MAG TPA: bifunctional riboflavin kinase/FAD synthetase [Myxococcota bacterium]|nr:bifunctional riboflavin kinase/FAD synthetase [Myxococcota bacterium]